MAAVGLRFETPFPAGGEGVSLKFSNANCAELQKRFGDKWFTGAFARWDNFDVDYLRTCVELGGRKDGKFIRINFDELDAPLMQIAEQVVNALFISVHGVTFTEYLTDQAKKLDDAKIAGGLEDNAPPESKPDNISQS